MPGLGFDEQGNRLGRGGGYYDRFFATTDLRAQRCGFAFAEQVVDSVPTAEHDVSMNFLVTDNDIKCFNADRCCSG